MTIGFHEIRNVDSFCDHVRSMANRGERDKALGSIVEFVARIIELESSWATAFSSPELDELCQELGKVPPYLKAAAVDPDCSVFLVTAVAGIGGHTRVLMDLVRADSGKKTTILVTNVSHALNEDEVKATLKKVGLSGQIEVAANLNLEETLTWLQRKLASVRPARTYILQHHFDAVIAAAVQPELVDKLFYYHHGDHSLALGVHLPHATHVDFNGKGYHHCRTGRGIKNNVYWPLVADVKTHRANNPFMASGTIATATSGGVPKFDTSYLREQVPYKYSYADILPNIMRITGGRHYHIGPLPHALARKIKENLASAGVDKKNFVNIPWVENVASELVARQVDLYIGSFPLGGGRAAIEAMGAGVPLLLHSNYVSSFFTDINEVYPEVLSWRDTDELKTILNGLTRELLANHARRARAFYEMNCAPHQLKGAIEATLQGTPPNPPSPPVYLANSLQRFLDLRPSERPSAGYLRLAHAIDAAQPIRSRHLLAILWRRLIKRKKDKQRRMPEESTDLIISMRRMRALRRWLHWSVLITYSALHVGAGRTDAVRALASNTRFVGLLWRRYWNGLGADIRLNRRQYVNFRERTAYSYRSRRSGWLFLADVLKVHGLLDDAEAVYRRAACYRRLIYPALCGLGDLLLLQARWAQEFSVYANQSQAIDPGVPDWRRATFDEAIEVLSEARALKPHDERAAWLLAIAYDLAGQSAEAVEQVRALEIIAAPRSFCDLGHLRMRATFPVAPADAVAGGNKHLGGWIDGRGGEWRVSTAEVYRGDALPDDGDFATERVGSESDLNLESGYALAGRFTEYRSQIAFSAPYVTAFSDATILPLFGGVVAGGYLIADSIHHHEKHFDVFVNNVRAVAKGSVLLCGPNAMSSKHENTVFFGTNGNYYHWLIEDLPRLVLVERSRWADGRAVLVDEDSQPWQVDLLARFGVSRDRLRRDKFDRPIAFRDVLVPSRLSTHGVVHPEAARIVRARLLQGAPSTAKPGKRLYVTRKTVPGRAILNAVEITKQFKRAGFAVVDPAALSIDRQIELFSDAEVIAGPAGAGLTNAVFAPVGARIIQLGSTDVCGETYTSLAASIGQRSCWCFGRGFARSYPRWIWTNFDFFVDPRDVNLCLDRML